MTFTEPPPATPQMSARLPSNDICRPFSGRPIGPTDPIKTNDILLPPKKRHSVTLRQETLPLIRRLALGASLLVIA